MTLTWHQHWRRTRGGKLALRLYSLRDERDRRLAVVRGAPGEPGLFHWYASDGERSREPQSLGACMRGAVAAAECRTAALR